MGKLKLAVIIPTFNRKDYLSSLLSNLIEQDVKDVDLDVIVVVDGSTDGTLELLDNVYPEVSVVLGDGKWWWTKSINEGIEVARNRDNSLFLLMNDDTIIEPSFLRLMIEGYYSSGKGVLGAISVTDSSPHKIFFSGIKKVKWGIAKFYRYHKHFTIYDSSIRGVHPSLFLPGRGMMFDLDVLNKIGMFSEDKFPQYYSDFDFSYRAFINNFNTNVIYDSPIYSFVKLTAEGNKSNSTFIQLLRSFSKPMSSNNFKRTYLFYKRHAGPLFFASVGFHYIRIIGSFFLIKFKKG
ncbi:glycosyltransferase family 2 protein [Arcticibacter tournemirensis]